jgi:hypothetical protein
MWGRFLCMIGAHDWKWSPSRYAYVCGRRDCGAKRGRVSW